MDNKVSEKAIWEGAITPDNDTPSLGSQIQAQPQMMFCYKCNNVIPNNSTYCPYCQIKLYTECPKCGIKYSSQYPACNQCGTNRQEYIALQQRERERKEAIEREKRRQQEIEERKRLEAKRKKKEAEEEKERQDRLKRYEQQSSEKQQKEAYLRENEEIKKTKEYETTYSILREALTVLDDKKNKNTNIAFLLHSLIYIYLVISYIIDLANRNMELFSTIGIIIFLIGIIGLIVNAVGRNVREWQEEYLMHYAISDSRYQESLITKHIISMVWYQGKDRLSDCCIIAYRKKHGLNINYKWHSMR